MVTAGDIYNTRSFPFHISGTIQPIRMIVRFLKIMFYVHEIYPIAAQGLLAGRLMVNRTVSVLKTLNKHAYVRPCWNPQYVYMYVCMYCLKIYVSYDTDLQMNSLKKQTRILW
jgi:hypothetical protein